MASEYLNLVTYPYQRIIIENIYHKDVTLSMLIDDYAKEFEGACSCAEEKRGCTSPSSCFFRASYAECNDECSESCSNKDIQKKNWWKGLYIKDTQNFGLGVFTKIPIPPFTFICEFVGEVVTNDEFQRRRVTEYADFPHHYAMELKKKIVIDSYKMCGIASYVNSSCRPNCETKRIIVNGYSRMTLWSLGKTIQEDEELSYAYNFENDLAIPEFQCACGEENCVSLKNKQQGPQQPCTQTNTLIGMRQQEGEIQENKEKEEEEEVTKRRPKKKAKVLVISDDEEDDGDDERSKNIISQDPISASLISPQDATFTSQQRSISLSKISPLDATFNSQPRSQPSFVLPNSKKDLSVVRKLDLERTKRTPTAALTRNEGTSTSNPPKDSNQRLQISKAKDATDISKPKSQVPPANPNSGTKPKIWKEKRGMRGTEFVSDDEDDFLFFW